VAQLTPLIIDSSCG